MNARATLTLSFSDSFAQNSLTSVLAPDNKALPKGLELSEGRKGRVLEFQVTAASPSTALSTILALLRDISLFQEVWLLSQARDARVRRE